MGLHISVALPGLENTGGMDVSSTKLFRYHQKSGKRATQAGRASFHLEKKEMRYQRKEGRKRVEACYNRRIIVLPFDGSASRLNELSSASDPTEPVPAHGMGANDPIIRRLRAMADYDDWEDLADLVVAEEVC